MSNHQKHFNSKYPIICSGMNKVSTVELALAVNQTGCYPSLVAFNHLIMDPTTDTTMDDTTMLELAMEKYKNATGNSDYILGISCSLLQTEKAMKLLYKYKPAYLELFDYEGFKSDSFINIIKNLQASGVKVLGKILETPRFLTWKKVCQNLDGVIIKSDKAAGRVSRGSVDLVENIQILRNYRSDWIIVAQGGIHDSAGIKELLDAGADAVSMGTVFALSAESSISPETKQKMLEASYADTVKIGEANQNGLVFTKTENDVENNTIGLAKGVQTGVEGHVFAGQAIDYITEIKPISRIVAELTVGL